ncbi:MULTISPECIES: cytochrome c oxidase subunit 3 [Nitrosomonas]|uniref:cytochrome-c oxidase n=2 Tax=Nitrosomonas eutropha TaxID=916 RepID=A0ABX5M667_9PROT|nr:MULTISPECIES: cytochrome c oxidase subunit 3 [Nitrosomonas]ABI60606.1 cytochrome c oxidase, subunit III [Nitrosomonas eutropha C91]MXS81191.1 cytochrome c oxidase subunit 3 [Nitrosomonas sp. GH22]PXV77516.1 cytochrome c oxidase subunit 3 [Nitrosomonas eutropha]SCX22103.1 cytochrome c oxidase subunit 3 [Nitrosomonas eutropha]SDW59729.1 cytochrome c oxidase subunit 3 [Nitrosomonas eutropha]
MSQGTGYYVPSPSKWPIIGTAALFFMAFGAAFTMSKLPLGYGMLLTGLAILAFLIYGWFREVALESEAGKYKVQEDKSFRWSMGWFIFSEVMFFASFFGALFYMRVLSVPWLAGSGQELLWPDFAGGWPTAGPGFDEKFTPMGAWGIPAINTTLLLTSGITITLAHWALKKNDRGALKLWLFATIALGITFLGFQIYEYGHAYADLNLKMTSGAYGSTFFMLTGFHGFHVTVGTIMLIAIFFRSLNGHFTPEHHFGFEGVAWYWHFVDVVWLALFIFVYLL